jgi:hypothetical protein
LFINPATDNSTAYRVYNSLDVVPNSWASVAVIETYYVPSPRCTGEIKGIVDKAIGIVGTQYVQVGTANQESAIKLPGTTVVQPTFGLDLIGDALFLRQLQQQPAPSMYQQLLQAPQMISAAVGKVRAVKALLLR